MRDRIFIVTDGGHEIGMGHVMRCLSLAKILRIEKMDVGFFIHSKRSILPVYKRIESEGFKVRYLDSGIADVLYEGKPDILFIDLPHYISRQEYGDKARELGIVYMAVNDMFLNGEDADVIINPSILTPLLEKGGRWGVYSGAEYAIINDSFYNTPFHFKERGRVVKNILITMGGSDSSHQTKRVLESLMESMKEVNIDVVLGMAYNDFTQNGYNDAEVKFHYDAKNMAELMMNADMAFIAGGITLYEAAFTGLPVIIIAQDKYQELTAREFQRRGFGLYLGMFDSITGDIIKKSSKRLFKDYDIRSKMSNTGRNLVDGKGVFRVAEIIKANLGHQSTKSTEHQMLS
ncbi:MAG: UDP-2,4-diacetamido-2,4,6-trideoxy-beta-L-altropyranose hydrolase [Nitrospinae bacterium]|nr:UDP-2,4-diacetamido-2,4,6-trideoxy-beta-L-altropyranose hydrolase [Nitrospinota bacterium]